MEKFNIIFPAMDIRIPPPHPFFYKEPSWLLGELGVVPSGELPSTSKSSDHPQVGGGQEKTQQKNGQDSWGPGITVRRYWESC